ncbi:MAG: ABC transporter substrate-binding protein [Burkholderiales bacterium]|jgi:peptide/nickel transport system substrate-binding protein|nr:ABC transporter substrate-binding protein [Burkholderiales bacterium]
MPMLTSLARGRARFAPAAVAAGFVVAAAGVVSVGGCSREEQAKPQESASAPAAAAAPAGPKRGGTLVFARPEEPQTFDPFIPNDNGSIYAIEQVCDSLVEPDTTGEGLRPGLAASWTVSDDKLVWTFTLRDAKFTDGTAVTADDVVFSLKKAGAESAPLASLYAPIKAVEAVDPKTVKVTLKQPYGPVLSALSAYAAAVVSKAAYEKSAEAFGQMPVCSGPFKVKEYVRGTRVVLERNADYWEAGKDGQPLPYLDAVEMRYVPDTNARVLGLKGGEIDAIAIVPFNEAEGIKGTPGLTLEAAPVFRLDYVYINHKAKPLDNKDLRLAMNLAADREAIMKVVFFGFGEIPNSYMPKVNFHSDAVEKIPYDLEKAKALVKSSGYKGQTIKLMVDTGNAPSRQIATILQQGWSEAGLKVEIVEFDVGTAFDMTSKGNYMAYVSYITSDINDTDELATLQADGTGSSKSFFSNYRNAEVTKLLTAARSDSDAAKRAELYAKVQDTVYHDGYSVPLNFTPSLNAHHAYVEGWQTSKTGWWWLKDVIRNK